MKKRLISIFASLAIMMTSVTAFAYTTTDAIEGSATEENIVVNVAAGRNVVTSKGKALTGWTDGVLDVANITGQTANKLEQATDGTYAIIDLGDKTKITGVGALIDSAAPIWHYRFTKFYGTNDLTNGISGATLLTEITKDDADLVAAMTTRNPAYEVSGEYQYILVQNANSDCFLHEIYVYTTGGVSDVSVSSANFTSTPNAVTNVGTDEMITVEFSDAIDFNSATTATVYAVAQADLGTAVKTGDKHGVKTIKLADNKFAIDASTLAGYVSYKLVIENLLDANGNVIPTYTSDAFTTAEIARLPYAEGKQIVNIAKNKTLIHPSANLSTWVDGNVTNAFNLTDLQNYFALDLGEATKIGSVGIVWHGPAWTNTGLEVTLSNKKDLTADELSNADWSSFKYAKEPDRKASGGVLDYALVDSENEYQYVIFKMNGTYSTSVTIRELMVYAYAEPATASVNFTSTPNAVTNIDTNEMIKVTFSKPVNTDTVNVHTVYAICNTDRNPANTGIKVGSTKGANIVNKTATSFEIDIYNFDGLVDYTLVIDGVKDLDGVPVTKFEGAFKTGVIARLPYQQGKVIKNVSKNKTITTPVATSVDDLVKKSGQMAAWLDGDVTTNDNFKHLEDGYAVIDLGNKYKIETMGVVWAAGNWTNKLTQIYLTNDLENIPETSVGFYWADRLQGCGDLVDYVADLKSVFNDEDGYRYIVVKCSNNASGSSVSIRELCAFAYEEANEMYIAKNVSLREEEIDGEKTSVVDKITLTAHALRTGDNTLILAEYNNDKLVNVIPQPCAQGAAMIQVTPVEGNTYKAFLWNSLTGMDPVIESVEF